MKKVADCPYCKSAISKRSETVKCPTCSTSHHSECWREAGNKCTIYGCKGRLLLPIIPQRQRVDLYRLFEKAGETIVGYTLLITIVTINFIEPSGIYVFFPKFITKILFDITICGVFGFVAYLVVGFVVAIFKDLS